MKLFVKEPYMAYVENKDNKIEKKVKEVTKLSPEMNKIMLAVLAAALIVILIAI